jgi:hypothetical protein
VWREFDEYGRPLSVAIDTNFDGRPDVQEYYAAGALVRREIDRKLRDQVDLVQEFDPVTHLQTRSVEDLDGDGTADLLILFRDGQPVFSEYAPSRASVSSGALRLPASVQGRQDEPLRLTDPFRDRAEMRGFVLTPRSSESVGLSTSGGLPKPRVLPLTALIVFAPFVSTGFTARDFAALGPASPRGPPIR